MASPATRISSRWKSFRRARRPGVSKLLGTQSFVGATYQVARHSIYKFSGDLISRPYIAMRCRRIHCFRHSRAPANVVK